MNRTQIHTSGNSAYVCADAGDLYLTRGGKATNALWTLRAGIKSGVSVTRRARGYSDFGLLSSLAAAGLMECRRSGLRGGKQWHTTEAGERIVGELAGA